MQFLSTMGARLSAALLVAASALAVPSVAAAEDRAPTLNAIAKPGMGAPKLAAQFQLKMRLADGRLARALLDLGVRKEDAAAAAKLAAGHLGTEAGGCDALVSIERNPDATYSLMRVQLATDTRRTVIEWRGSDLVLASDTAISNYPPVA